MPVGPFLLVGHLLLADESKLPFVFRLTLFDVNAFVVFSLFLHPVGEGILPAEGIPHDTLQLVVHTLADDGQDADEMDVDVVLFLIEGIDDAAGIGVEVAEVADETYFIEPFYVGLIEKEESDAGIMTALLQFDIEMPALIVEVDHLFVLLLLPLRLDVHLAQCLGDDDLMVIDERQA